MDGLPHLPGDVVNSILLKLPVKSLSRFKSCCQSWHCCIDDADFIKSHLHKSSVDISRQKIVLVNFIPSLRTGINQFDIVSTEASINGDSKVVYLNIPEFFSDYFYLEVFSCSGLVFVTSYGPGYSMTLFNPAVGKYKLIPNSLLSQKTNRCSSTSPIFGFAYDFVTEDYKYTRLKINVVEVYSVKNHSCPYLYNNQVSLNGVIHRMSYNRTIISFHLVDQKFTVTIVPSTCGKQPTLHALGDGVCVFTTKDRWNCIHKFPTLLSLIGMPPICKRFPGTFLFVKENGNMLWRKHDGSFIDYDVQKNEYTEFNPSFGPRKTSYMESLVSLKIPWD
ncbi:hypothetical protein R3W88_004480 [Solanum pinnatisectum]|uniref:F-box domain-containing protein n=1 Tax=Solanum pinnatisectum TaxID=50273 RepID=A0AAV9K9T6_9SOLN|nr:hypothetical protein R3W88_004480 [Solanum pinnatisectum]